MSKIYVGNLTSDFDERDLEAGFEKFGRIESCAVKRGYGFVNFRDDHSAAEALREMDDTELKGRRIRVAYANSGSYSTTRRERPEQARENGPVSRNLFVANIPPNVRLRELEEFFERYGKVQNVKILPQVKGNVTMSAFVDFSTEAEAESAHTAELVLDGKCLRTDYNFRKGDRRRERSTSREQGSEKRYRETHEPRRGNQRSGNRASTERYRSDRDRSYGRNERREPSPRRRSEHERPRSREAMTRRERDFSRSAERGGERRRPSPGPRSSRSPRRDMDYDRRRPASPPPRNQSPRGYSDSYRTGGERERVSKSPDRDDHRQRRSRERRSFSPAPRRSNRSQSRSRK
uniref:Uncharacterized protein AlNc14C442G11684 n=1 Tax=Albugo laibachii Nc14 TaxID=890382 RepID=F0WZU3_9STRA|nr:conserved hypothetical protein [Albugo laibachii Nc14]|eukprot:CCA27020.1 conserved hypothetical protein [Albugo laibachii Nc14]